MAAPSISDELLELIRKSGVVDEKRLDAYIQSFRAGSLLPKEPGRLAGLLVRDGVLTHFQAEQLLLGRWKRFNLGKYRVLERLGSGGMGDVYLCEHRFMRRRTAVKVLPASRAEDPACLERFYREARAVAALDHPNIVRAYDIDHEDQLHFLVMEYVEGANLQDIVKKHGPMDIHRASHYMRQAAVGLQHAFQAAGLIHRDIKPGNLLVDRQGVVKILDMGLARFFHDQDDMLTQKYDEAVLGTADYLAPEQALDSHSVDIRADIYALGATFYFLLTGSTPFADGSVAQKLIWHQIRQPRPVRSLRPEVPPDLAAVIEKMMAKKAADRYQMPAEVVVALAPWTKQPIAPPPDKEMPRLSLAALGGSSMEIKLGVPPAGTPARIPMASSKVMANDPTPPPPMNLPSPDQETQVTFSAVFREVAGPSMKAVPAFSLVDPTPAAGLPAQRPTKVLAQASLSSIPGESSALAGAAVESDQHSLPLDLQEPRFKKALPWWRTVRGNRRILLLGAASVAVVGILAVLFGWAFSNTGPKPTDTNQDLPVHIAQTLRVSRSGSADSFTTVHDALQQADAGDRILVLDEIIEEPLILENGILGKGVTIEAGVIGKAATWKCPANPLDGKFITLAKVSGLHLKGFTFDGQDRVDDLVRISGPCPGLVLEDITLQGFKHSALALWNCTGEKGEGEVLFKGLRIVAFKDADSAINFNVDPNSDLSCRSIEIVDCRFEGPFHAAVRIGSSIAEVRFKGNRFFQPVDGFLYEEAVPRHQVFMTVESNTFCEVKQDALHFGRMPLSVCTSQVVSKDNIFAKTAKLVQVDDKDEKINENDRDRIFPSPEGNIRDKLSQEGNIPEQAAEKEFSLPTDPNKDDTFLRYTLSPSSQK